MSGLENKIFLEKYKSTPSSEVNKLTILFSLQCKAMQSNWIQEKLFTNNSVLNLTSEVK